MGNLFIILSQKQSTIIVCILFQNFVKRNVVIDEKKVLRYQSLTHSTLRYLPFFCVYKRQIILKVLSLESWKFGQRRKKPTNLKEKNTHNFDSVVAAYNPSQNGGPLKLTSADVFKQFALCLISVPDVPQCLYYMTVNDVCYQFV